MSKKIGDYIHLHLDNYRNYGTNLQLRRKNEKGEWEKIPNGSVKFDFNDYYDKYMSKNRKIKQYNDQKALQDLEDDLNKIMGRAAKNNNEKELPDRYVKEVWKYVNDKLNDSEVFKYDINANKAGVIRGNVTATTKEDIQQAITESVKKLKSLKSGSSIRLNTIISKIRELEKVVNTLYGENTKNKLTTEINTLYKGLEEVSKIAESQLREDGFESLTQLLTGKKTQDLVGQINDLITLYATVPNLNVKSGDAFEFLIAYARGVAKENLQDTITNAFTGKKVGDERLSVLIDPNLFSDKIDFSSLSRTEPLGENTYIKIGASQQKVDVRIENNTDPNFEPMNISAKNVNLRRDVEIVNASPLITFLQMEESTFANHYLNITAMHNEPPYDKTKGEEDLEEVQTAHKAMKLVILYRALTGDLFQRNQRANIFIYNDTRPKGGVTVVDMYTLIQKAMEGTTKKSFEQLVKIDSNGKDLSRVRFANERAKSGYGERISNLILDLHKQKITAKLKSSLLTNIAKNK